MVSNPSQRDLNLGKYSIIPLEATTNLRVGSFWKRKQIDRDDSNNNDTACRGPKQPALTASDTELNCQISSGRGSSNSVTMDSLSAIPGHELEPADDDATSSGRTDMGSEETEIIDQGIDVTGEFNNEPQSLNSSGHNVSDTSSPILNVDTLTSDSSVGSSHESVLVEVDPNQYINGLNQVSQISDNNLSSIATLSANAPLRVRKKIYPKQLAYETIMSGVNFVMSGYEHPRRSKLRDKAIAMGARYHAKWSKDTTHLICAFKNTPKHKEVMAANGRVVREHWIQDCSRRKLLLDWRSYKLGKYSYPDSEEEVSDDINGAENCDQLNSSSQIMSS